MSDEHLHLPVGSEPPQSPMGIEGLEVTGGTRA
jgi:hypothetical protein